MNETSSVLVTGGAGYLGGFVLDELRESGSERVVLDCADVVGVREALSVDLVDGPPDLGALRPRVVIHLAGMAHVVPRNDAERRRFFEVNVDGTRNLLLGLDAAMALPEALVFVSTVAVYGLDEGAALDEETPLCAEDPYGESKRKAEELVTGWGDRTGVRIGIVRLPLVAGRSAPGNLGAMVSALRSGRYLGIGRGDARRSMVLAKDVARILPRVAEVGGIYHLTDGHHPSICELEESLCNAMGRPDPRRLPLPAAKALGFAGDAISAVGLPFRFTSRSYRKMISTLTFSDDRARRKLGWNPARVVGAAGELVA
jgi:nucleoside-diphosphate-sugar epimerase